MNRKGFTLVEVIITCAVIGIIAAIALPAFVAHKVKSETSYTVTCAQGVAKHPIECKVAGTGASYTWGKDCEGIGNFETTYPCTVVENKKERVAE